MRSHHAQRITVSGHIILHPSGWGRLSFPSGQPVSSGCWQRSDFELRWTILLWYRWSGTGAGWPGFGTRER